MFLVVLSVSILASVERTSPEVWIMSAAVVFSAQRSRFWGFPHFSELIPVINVIMSVCLTSPTWRKVSCSLGSDSTSPRGRLPCYALYWFLVFPVLKHDGWVVFSPQVSGLALQSTRQSSVIILHTEHPFSDCTALIRVNGEVCYRLECWGNSIILNLSQERDVKL